MGRRHLPLLGRGALHYLPAYACCNDSYWGFRLLRRSQHYRFLHDFPLSTRDKAKNFGTFYQGLSGQIANTYQEELDYIFAIPTRRFMSHQVGTVLPWWIKAKVLRRKIGPCPSLWTFDGRVDGDTEFIEKIRRQSEATGARRSSVAKFLNN